MFRLGGACSVTGVGEAIIRAGLARAVTAQLACSSDVAVDSVCEAAVRENILEGQPAALTSSHKDCGILAVRVRSSGMTRVLHEKFLRQSCHWAFQTMHCKAFMNHAVQGTLLPVSTAVDGASVSSPCYAGCVSQVASSQLGHQADTISTDTAVQSGSGERTKYIDVELGVSCNSHSMGFAFVHTGMRTPKCMVLRQKPGADGCPHDYEAFCCFGSQHSWAA